MNEEYDEDHNIDYTFKLLIIGDNGVGKTSLTLRFVANTFSDSYIATIGIDFKSKIVKIDENKVQLKIWDTAGQERFASLTTAYYRGVSGAVIVYDVENMESFMNAKKWFYSIKNNCGNVKTILVGNKDDSNHKIVKTSDARKFANEVGVDLIEASAKENKNVKEMFTEIARQTLHSMKISQQNHDNRWTSEIKLNRRDNEKKGCC